MCELVALVAVFLGLCCIAKLVEIACHIAWFVTKNLVLPALGLAILLALLTR